MKVILRDYQTDAINSVLNSYNTNANDSAILYLCTGAGKTIISSELTRKFLDELNAQKIMFVVHRDELVKQTIKKMQLVMGKDIIKDIGIVKGEYNQVGRKITIASIQSLLSNKRLNQVKDAGPYDLVITDECFPKGTLIDGKPIETLKKGDLVSCFNHRTNQIEFRPIKHLFKKKIEMSLITINTKLGKKITSTFSHPFYNGKNYVPAILLQKGDLLYVNKFNNQMQDLSNRIHNDLIENETLLPVNRLFQTNGICFLQSELSKDKKESNILRENERNEFKEESYSLRENEGKESKLSKRSKRKSKQKIKRDRAQTISSRGQWEGFNSSTGDVIKSVGLRLESGVYSEDKRFQLGQISESLQDRYSESNKENSNRSRWNKSQQPNQKSSRFKKRQFLEKDWVESIEIQELTNTREYSELHDDNYVYNIEVEHNNNYFANGILVHNCHHYSQNLWRTAIDSLKPTFEVGLTATPNELEDKYLDKIVFRYSIFQAIKERNLVDIKGLKIKLELNLNKVKVKDGDYSETQIQNEMMRPDIMQKTIETYKSFASNRKTVIFCVNVLHAQTLCNLFKADGISAECITGETPSNIRDLYYADFAAGKIKVLLSVNVLTEGWDETSLDCVIMARPTLSETLYIQCIGRGLRIHPGKVNCLVIDLVGNSDIHKVMQLGVLFGKAPKKIKEVTEKLKELGIDQIDPEEDEILSVRDLITKEEEFGLHKVSEERKFDWIQFEDKYCLSLGSKFGFIIIEKNPKEFNMFSIKRYYSKGWKDRIDTLCEDIPLDWAINMSEQEVQGIVPASSIGLIDKSAEWKGGFISDKQKEILIKFGVKDIPNSKGQASKLISELIIKKQVKDYEIKANEDNEGIKIIEQIKGYIKTGSFLALDKERVKALDFNSMSLSECKRLINFNNIKLKQF